MANAVATPEIKPAPPPPKIEARSQAPKGDSKEVKQFGQIATEALTGKRKGTEALAAIGGWLIKGKIDIRLLEMQKYVGENSKLSPEKGKELMKRIKEMGDLAKEGISPAMEDLDKAIHEAAESGTLSTFMRDLSYHYIKAEIEQLKQLKQLDLLGVDIDIQQHEQDLKNIEAKRSGVTPEQDEVVTVAAVLRGEKSLPNKFKDNPLEAIDDFFEHNLKKVVKNEKMRTQLAQKLELQNKLL